jgi:hypothetical protein
MSVYVGIDVHRKRSQVAVIDQDGTVLMGAAAAGLDGIRELWTLLRRFGEDTRTSTRMPAVGNPIAPSCCVCS